MITTTSTESSNLKAELNLGYIWLISAVAALGGLLFGWDWVVIGGAKPFFQRYFQLTSEAQIGWANSCALIGCLVGALVAGALSDKFGRKRLLILSAFLFAVTSLGNALAGNFSIFIFWRMLGGVAIGLASNLSPMYIAEVAPAQMRGKLVSINQLTIVIGILLAQVINWSLVRNLPAGATDEFIRNSWFGQQGWRWMFGLTAAPSLLFFFGMFAVPESPRWLAKNGKPELAQKNSGENRRRKIWRGGDGGNQFHAGQRGNQARPVRRLARPEDGEGAGAGRGAGGVPAMVRHQCDFQLRGGNFQSGRLRYFQRVEQHRVDRLGESGVHLCRARHGGPRRAAAADALWRGGAGGDLCGARTSVITRSVKGLPMLLLVLAAIACYSMSLAPVTWVVISEIFPNRIRGAAMSVAVCALWIACFILTFTFPDSERQARRGGHVLALRGDLRAGLRFHFFQTAGDQGQNAGTNRT